MINLKKQAWRTGALCLAGVVALSVTGVSVYAKTSEKKETEVKEQIRDAVDDIWKSEDTSAASIDETVYVILNADGTQQNLSPRTKTCICRRPCNKSRNSSQNSR